MVDILTNVIEHLFRVYTITVPPSTFNPFIEFILVEVKFVTSFT